MIFIIMTDLHLIANLNVGIWAPVFVGKLIIWIRLPSHSHEIVDLSLHWLPAYRNTGDALLSKETKCFFPAHS